MCRRLLKVIKVWLKIKMAFGEMQWNKKQSKSLKRWVFFILHIKSQLNVCSEMVKTVKSKFGKYNQ